MSARLGISIATDSCAVVLMRRGRIRWHRRAMRTGDASLESTLRGLFEGRRASRRRSTVVVALGASHSQVKRVAGIPSTLARDVAARLVHENSSSFFLVPSRLVTTGVECSADGTAWSSALDVGTIDEARGALAAIGLVARSFVADVVAMAAVLPAGDHRTRDGEVQMEFATANGAITRCRRLRHVSSAFTEASGGLPSPLRALGDEAPEYVSAFAAASMPLRNQLVWRPPADPRRRARRRRVETLAASIAFATSLVAASTAPGVRAAIDATHWTRQAASAAAVRRDGAAVDAELRRVTTTVDRLDRFQATRAELPRLLGDIALALPDSTALLSLHVDTTEIDFAVLTPRAADVISQLSDVHKISSPRVVGSVVRDVAARVTLERATIRARRRREPISLGGAPHTPATTTSAP